MALSQHDLLRLREPLRWADGLELVRGAAERLLQELIEAEAGVRFGAQWGEHTATGTTWRNGHREKTVTHAGAAASSSRSRSCGPGASSPSLLERRRRIGRVLCAVVMEA
ncbi:hypothetical protein SUDANB54_06881 [Streptomyces sp. enrichment culture]